MSSLMYPKVFEEFERRRSEYGPVDKLPTKAFIAGLDNGESCEVSIAKDFNDYEGLCADRIGER